MQVLLRYDDYSELGDAELDCSVLEAMCGEGYRPLVGVIPAIADVSWSVAENAIPLRRLSPERIRRLRSLVPQHVDVALHGYSHQAVTRFTGLFEFGDAVDRGMQVARLSEGKKILEDAFGTPIQWFIPPWNAYGTSTLGALVEAGFRGISGDAYFGVVNEGITFAPASCLPRELTLLPNARTNDESAAVVVTMHDYDFAGSDTEASISSMRSNLREMSKGHIIPTGFNQLWGDPSRDGSRVLANQSLRKHLRSPMKVLFNQATGIVYWSEREARKKQVIFDSVNSTLTSALRLYRRIRAPLRG